MWQRAKNFYHFFVAVGAHTYYRFPSRGLQIIGVTGTSGKTTTTIMIYEILRAAGYKVSMLSSIKAVIAGKDYDTGFHVTTPDPHVLPKYLRMSKDTGDQYFILEISSHALDQNRAASVHFTIGVLTTLAHEHLDYHKTFLNYAKAKFKLLHQAETAVIPVEGIEENIKDAVGFDQIQQKAVTFGLERGDFSQKDWQLHMRMPGDFNLKNALAAAAVAAKLGVKKEVITKALEAIESLPGRFEEVATGKDFRVVIDFAHKPDALEGVLQAARKQIKGKGRIIVMYGAASQRDILKRPMMGAISGKLAEITILTDEDPRYENSMKIINEIAQGCIRAGAKEMMNNELRIKNYEGNVFYKIPDRKEAIEFIITKLARKDDIILLCGKGHESSMSYNGEERPWSEHKTVWEALRSR